MKKIMILTLVLSFAIGSFAQETEVKKQRTETDYYKKSRNQNTNGWMFTGVGAGIIFGTMLAEGFSVVITVGQSKATHTTPFYVIGSACVATGIVYFIASGRNKRKAKALSAYIDFEGVPVLQGTMITHRSFPVAGIKLNL
jgi:hypothetical protein